MPVVVGYVLCQVALSARLIVTPTSLHINVTPGCALLIMTVSVTSASFCVLFVKFPRNRERLTIFAICAPLKHFEWMNLLDCLLIAVHLI